MRRSLLIILAATALLGAACGGGAGGGGGGGGGGATTPACTAEVVAMDNFFEPDCAQVTAGSDVTVTNEGSALHSFTVDDLDIDEDVQSGSEITVTVDADPGTYRFHCKYHGGMFGDLSVE